MSRTFSRNVPDIFRKFAGNVPDMSRTLPRKLTGNLNFPNFLYYFLIEYVQIISQVPQLASNIYRWVTNNFNVTTQQMETYNDQMPDDVIAGDDSLPELEASSDDDDNIMDRVDH